MNVAVIDTAQQQANASVRMDLHRRVVRLETVSRRAVGFLARRAGVVGLIGAVDFPAARVLGVAVAVTVALPGKAALDGRVVQVCHLAAARLRRSPRVCRQLMKPHSRTASRCSNGRVIVRIRSAERLAAGRRRGHLRTVRRQRPRLSTSDRVIAANLDVAGCRDAKPLVRPRGENLHLSLLTVKMFSNDLPIETPTVAKHRSRQSLLTRKRPKVPRALILQPRRKSTSNKLNPRSLIRQLD